MKHTNSLSSLEDELFHEPRKQRSSGWWMWSLAVIMGYLFVYRSTRPTVRLCADPPPTFYEGSRTWKNEQQQHERRVAQAYWRVAVQRIQIDYSQDRPLPANPPPQFQISGAQMSPKGDMAASRAHYWSRLREVWGRHDAWVTHRRWSTDWVENSLNSLPQYIPQWVSNFFQSLISFFINLAQRIP